MHGHMNVKLTNSIVIWKSNGKDWVNTVQMMLEDYFSK
jgi:hypothetical protein